jgi:hypothetical protein
MRLFGSGLLAVGILAIAVPAFARVDPICVANARATRDDCVKQCRDDFWAQKFMCRDVSPGCGVACLAGRLTCVSNVRTILQTGQVPGGTQLENCLTGTNGCDQALSDAKALCFAPNCPQGQTCTSCQLNDTTCQDCVDNAQIAAFTCRDTCRDAYRANAIVVSELANCKAAFKTCVKACPKTTP